MENSTSGQPPKFRLIAGLGNPGREYEQTRHNIGFMILDKLADRAGTQFRHEAKWNADIAPMGKGVLLCKPLSFMNLSGEPVGNVAHFYKIPPQEILVILDDAALPLGRLRIRTGGSSGGQNGLQSILVHLGTEAVPRLRFGIGAAEGGRSLSDHVLSRFTPEEQPLLNESLDRAVAAIEFAQKNGAEAAMNHYNQLIQTN
jgi:peptidyl-tRNA hydrolase, PTH1 family